MGRKSMVGGEELEIWAAPIFAVGSIQYLIMPILYNKSLVYGV